MEKFKKYFPYLAFAIFLLVTVFASILLATKENVSFFGRAAGDKPQIWLLPSKVELNQKQSTEIKVFLNTNNQEVGGVDLVLKYNPQLIEIENNTIKPGVIFDYYRDRLVDNKKGIIRLSSLGKFKGQGTFATFKIKGKSPGEGKVEIVTPKVSLDSTVVWDLEKKENLLGTTQSLSVLVY